MNHKHTEIDNELEKKIIMKEATLSFLAVEKTGFVNKF